MKKVFKGLNIVIILVLVAIAIGISYIAIPFFGNQALIVRSGSMIPTIDVGSIAVVKKTNNKTYKTGDIIAFRSEKNPETVTTHRIVGIESLENGVFYKTRGDANNIDDAVLVSNENILGKTFIVIPYVGKILAFAKSDIGFPALIIFPAIVVILLEIWSIFKEIRKNRQSDRRLGPEGKNLFELKSIDVKKKKKFNLIGFKFLMPFLIFGLVMPSTFAYFSDSGTSTGNVFQASETFPQTANIYLSNGFICSDGATTTEDVFGTVTITRNGTLDVYVELDGALALTDYELWVNQDPGACPLSAPTNTPFITTDSLGDGSNTLLEHTLEGSATKFWVNLVSVGNAQVLRSTAVSF